MGLTVYCILGIWCGLSSLQDYVSSTMLAPEFAEMDEMIVDVLVNPKENSQWVNVINNISTAIQEIKNMMKLMKNDDNDMVQKAYEIYQLGKPKFIDQSMRELTIRDAAQVTADQFQTFHELRDDIDNLWNDFLDVLSEKTGEVLDYGVHGRAPGYGGEMDHGGGGYGGYGGRYGEERGDDGYGGGGGYGGGERYGGGYGGGGKGGFRGGRGGGRGRRGGGGYGGRGGYGPPYR